MVEVAEGQGQSKSAKRRAAKKAAAAAAEPAPAEAPAPAAKPKAKAEAKPEAVPQPAAKAAGKAKAKSAPAPAPAPEPAAVAEPVAKKKNKKKNVEETGAPAAPVRKSSDVITNSAIDDGAGGEWDMVCSGAAKKKQQQDKKRKERELQMAEDARKMAAMEAEAAKKGATITSLAPAGSTIVIPQKKEVVVPEVPKVTTTTITVNVPDQKIGIVIGPKGATLNLIKEKTGCSNIDSRGGEIGVPGHTTFTLTGQEEGVNAAAHALKELIEKGYTSLAYDNFEHGTVMVHPSMLPELIGKQGAVINKIKTELKVEISMPNNAPANSKSSKKYPVTIAGDSERVAKAKEIINDICMHYCHELTHPGQVHEEMEIPEWNWRYLIGKGGSEMRHIQNSYKVKVVIPREYSANQNVVIVGEPHLVTGAKNYIEKVIWNAENATKGRDREGGGGGEWEEEETTEAWMDQYMFKRN